MEGEVEEIKYEDNDSVILVYYKIDTTPGQSGSPVFLKRGSEWILIAAHADVDESTKLKVATGITRKLFSWI